MQPFITIAEIAYYAVIFIMIVFFFYCVWRSFQPVYYDTLRRPHRTQEEADEATRKADYGDE